MRQGGVPADADDNLFWTGVGRVRPNEARKIGVRTAAMLLTGTMLAGLPAGAMAQTAGAAPARATGVPAAQPQGNVIRSIRVEGIQRLEPETVLSYTKLRVGQPLSTEAIDQALKDLYASDFLADVTIAGAETGDLVIRVRENPVINRVILEGNKRLKDEKINPEIKLAPRQIFTRTAVRADVARIVELYRRQGRFAATVEPKMVTLDQNRVDVIFEINEGPKSKVRQINIIGNDKFSDGDLRGEMATKQARFFRLFSSNTSFDQDRMNYDQQKLRQFYLTEGYADFRVISAVAELTPDKEDFIITYVVEEGPRYKFGPVTVDSAIRDLDDTKLTAALPMKQGDWYNAKQVEDAVDTLSETAGLAGYAFATVQPQFRRDRDDLTMEVNFEIGEAQRTYVERIEITGNKNTHEKVIRREFRVNEGDPFNAFLIKRSQDRINSLGYFQDKFEIEQRPGSTPDRVILGANVEEKATGQLSLSAGFSSLERFIIQASISHNNFRGMGQSVNASVDYSSYAKSISLGFTEPYLFDRGIALGGTVFRQDYNSFNYINSSDRNTTYEQLRTGFQVVASVPLTEYWALSTRYSLAQDDVSLDEDTFYTNGVCDPLKAGRYYCDAVGKRLTSLVGFTLVYNSLNSRLSPTRGTRATAGVDFAGLGGDVKYVRGRVDAAKYFDMGSGFIFSAAAEGGYIHALQDSPSPGADAIRLTDRFYLGEGQFRGFSIRGVGPRVQRLSYEVDPTNGDQTLTGRTVDDALGGKAYYLAKAELEIPLGAGAREMGIRPSIFAQVGALFDLERPVLQQDVPQFVTTTTNGTTTTLPGYIQQQTDGSYAIVGCDSSTTTCTGAPALAYTERYVGDSPKPRLTVGIGANWNSPFGPLRIDLAKALITEKGDDPKLFTFNVGTSFR